MTDIIEITLTIDAEKSQHKVSHILAVSTGLSQGVIKDAMQKGAVWWARGSSKQRLRRASKRLIPGDELQFNYNPQLLQQKVPEPQLIFDATDYSVWFKPYGLYCQGSRWGDFSSINRWVEMNFHKVTDCTERAVYLVHRLDRATTGLILLAHTKKAARLFSELFQRGDMDKRYQAIVHGDFSAFPPAYEVDRPVDDKSARSLFSFVAFKGDCSLVDVALLTGRKHQIRQHLSCLGYPIVGDRLYGSQSKSESEPNIETANVKMAKVDLCEKDLQLQSVALSFTCPLTGVAREFQVDESMRLRL